MKRILYFTFIAIMFLLIADPASSSRDFDDCEKYILKIKEKIEKYPEVENIDELCYTIAETRLEQLGLLTKKNDIESTRLYMKVNEEYFNEAITYLDEAQRITKSKEMILDIYFLKFLIAKDKFQKNRAEAIFNELAKKIATYSDSHAVNKIELKRISDKFTQKGLDNYSLRLKLAYAQETGGQAAKDMAQEIKETADNYFDKGNLKKALRYYRHYLECGSEFLDYCTYKMALCLYFDNNYQEAIAAFQSFLEKYPKSAWFDDGFRYLSRLYFKNTSREQAIKHLERLIDKYPKRGIRVYAELLIGILFYGREDYDKALEKFKKITTEFSNSHYVYAAETLIKDIEEVKKGAISTYPIDSEETYKMWDPYTPVEAVVVPTKVEYKEDKDREKVYITVKPGQKVMFTLDKLKDLDKSGEYIQDKSDVSRLPRKIRDELEEDLLSIEWSSTGGQFLDKRQSTQKAWQAPGAAGKCTVSIRLDDLGLVRPPNTGNRKDAAKKLTAVITIAK